jgi:uncharacterized protein with von Willebrand factor type A (vWA) domain
MVSGKLRRGLVGLLIVLAGTVMGCEIAPKGLDTNAGPRLMEVPECEHCILNIVYIVDRSGSMFDILPAVKREVMASVESLPLALYFHVIMLADGQPFENKPMTMAHPTEKNKRALAEFFDNVKAEGPTDPVKGINRAFDLLDKVDKRRRKIIYLLTDGTFPDYEAVIEAFRSRNKKRDVDVNALLYGKKAPMAVKAMKHIAKENDGQYRYVDLKD